MISSREREPTYFVLFLVLLAGMCLWVLSLPSFPSQDGPMHVYYAHVLGALFHPGNPFTNFFYIRSYLPPYALYYYLLIALMKFASVPVAEKLIVCLLFVVQAFGFRLLAQAIGAGGSVASLWFLPLLLNWPLGMGFLNFLLALGFALWTLALWWSLRTKPTAPRMLGYLGLIALITITHPVPLLFVLTVTALDLAFRLLAPGQPNSFTQRLIQARRTIAVFAISCCASFYVLHFTDRNRVAQNFTQHAVTFKRLLKLSSLAYFSVDGLPTYLYRLGLFAILFGALYLACRTAFRRPSSTAPVRPWLWLLYTFLLLGFILIAPPDMNGSHHFTDRLVLLVWMCALLAASACDHVSAQGARAAAVAACCALIAVVVLGDRRIRPLATELAAARMQPFPERSGTPGILLGQHLSRAEINVAKPVNFDPYEWSPAYALTQTDTIPLNPPWLDLPIIPLATEPGMLNKVFSPSVMDAPFTLYETLGRLDPEQRAAVLRRGQFVLLEDVVEAGNLGLLAPDSGWRCRTIAAGVLCDHHAGS